MKQFFFLLFFFKTRLFHLDIIFSLEKQMMKNKDKIIVNDPAVKYLKHLP